VPRLSVWLIRGALCYLALGVLAGALLLVSRGVLLGDWVGRLRPIHVEFLLIGWTLQLALGVTFWILPRFRAGSARGREGFVWLSFVLLNTGVLAVALGQAFGLPRAVPLLGHGAETLAAAVFALHAWPRVKAFETTG
jgi:cbb3-type cytochrome oxidase subunit 1